MWKPVRLLVLLAILIVAVGAPVAGAQEGAGAFENIAPGGVTTGEEVERFPSDRYSLDYFVDVGITDLGSIPALVAHTIAGLIWDLTRFLVMSVISFVTWAFGFDLIGGSDGREGAIEPISEAITALRTEVIGNEWMIAAILVAGVWAIGNGLVRQRHSETLGRLAASVLFVTIAFAFVAEDQWVVRTVSAGVTDLSSSMLGIAAEGDPGDGEQAKQDVSNGLFETLVVRPYTVLEFGGTEHCTNSDAVAVPCDDASVDRRIDHLPERFGDDGSRSSVAGQGGYLDYFLATEPGTDEREEQYKILKGDEDAEDDDRLVDDHDEPAVAFMEEGNATERAGMAAFILVAELGAVILVGLLALGVVITQAVALLLLAFAPVFLILALIPDWGHRLFTGWLGKLAWALVAEVLLALALAVLLTVSSALTDATESLGFLLAFALQAAFFWIVLLNRTRLLAVAAGYDHRYPVPRGRGATARTARAAGARVAAAPAAALGYIAGRARVQASGPRTQERAIDQRGHAASQRTPDDEVRQRSHSNLQQRTDADRRAHQAEERRRSEVKALKALGSDGTPEQTRRLGELHRQAPPPSQHDLRGRQLEEIDQRTKAGMAPYSERQYGAEEREIVRQDIERADGAQAGNGAAPGRGTAERAAGVAPNGGEQHAPPSAAGDGAADGLAPEPREIRVPQNELRRDREPVDGSGENADGATPPRPRRRRPRPPRGDGDDR